MSELSYVHGASDKPLIGQTIGRYFDDACARHGQREALVVRHQGVRLSYAELRLKVDSLACGLRRLGLGRLPGDFHFRLRGREWHVPLASSLLLSLLAALVCEVVMTGFFLFVIMGVTDSRAPAGFAPSEDKRSKTTKASRGRMKRSSRTIVPALGLPTSSSRWAQSSATS